MPQIGLQVNTKPLEAKLRQARDLTEARRQVLVQSSDVVVRIALELASHHKDTGRYMRALAESGNKAGVGKYLLTPVGASAMQMRLLQILTNQVRRWKKFALLYRTEGRASQPYFKKILRNIAKAEEALDRFTRGKDFGAIVIDAFSSKRMASVRVNFSAYGGDGNIRTLGDQTFVYLHNKEPHASIVESRFGIMRKAITAMRSGPVQRLAKKEYKKRLVNAGFAA